MLENKFPNLLNLFEVCYVLYFLKVSTQDNIYYTQIRNIYYNIF